MSASRPQNGAIPAIRGEFLGASLGDSRRSKRLVAVGEALANAPGASLPKAIGSKSALAGAYRFLSNPAVDPDDVLGPHVRETCARAGNHTTVLSVHDTTEVEPCGEENVAGLGTLQPGKHGFFLHVSLLVATDSQRTPLGVVAAQRHTRTEPPKVKGRAKRKSGSDYAKIAPADKESFRWAEGVRLAEEAVGEASSLIHIGDRETDKYWLLSALITDQRRFIFRLSYDRRLVSEELSPQKLSDQLSSLEPVLTLPIEVSRRRASCAPRSRKVHGDREARSTEVHAAATSVEFKRPARDKIGAPTIRLNVVRVWEPTTPADGSQQIEWLLATTEPVETPEDLQRVVDYYRARWTIEEYFKALKTGCALESRQLESFHALQNALAIAIPIAWRLLLLRAIERQQPTAPAETVVSSTTVAVLRRFSSYKLPKKPSARDALLAIAALGGHLKNNGDPGWIVLGRGYEKVQLLELGWLAAQAHPGEP